MPLTNAEPEGRRSLLQDVRFIGFQFQNGSIVRHHTGVRMKDGIQDTESGSGGTLIVGIS